MTSLGFMLVLLLCDAQHSTCTNVVSPVQYDDEERCARMGKAAVEHSKNNPQYTLQTTAYACTWR